MNLHELTELVNAGESERVEFKKTTGQRSEAMRTVCAMLNALGGIVLFGVTDNRKVVGQPVSTHTLEEIACELRKLEPPAFPDVETVTLPSGNSVIALLVPGGGGPYTYDGRPYVRNGPTTSQMPQRRYERLLLERMHGAARWENQPAVRFTIDDLDHGEIVRTIDEAIRRQRLEEPGTRDVDKLLLGLGLIEDGQLLNAAVVLFGKANKLLPNYPQCILQMARFRGTDKSEFIDNRQEMGHAFDLFVRGQRFWRDHLPIAGRILPDVFERIDEPLYPPAALREALANALCHRDYSIAGGSVGLAIFDDRLEISSTGPLPFDLTPADLAKPHRSRPWNPLIAQAFYRRGLIEKWGRGTLKIAELLDAAGLPPAEYECQAGEVLVRFRPGKAIAPTPAKHDLSPLQQRLLEVLGQTGPATLSEIVKRLAPQAPRRTVQDNLQLLRQIGLVEAPDKRGRGGRWRLKDATP